MPIKPQVQEAEALINEGKRAQAVPLLMEVLRADRNDEYAWRLLAQAVDKPEHKARAQTEIERIQREKSQALSLEDDYDLPAPVPMPEKPKRDVSPAPNATQLLEIAGSAIKAKDYARARSALDDVLRLEPGNPTALRWLDKLDDEATFGTQSRAPVLIQQKGPGCLIQLLWFVFVGWWLGLLMIEVGYFMLLSIILLPVGIWILSNISQVLTLRKRPTNLLIDAEGNVTNLSQQIPQRGFAVRALWFVFVGWWLTGFWLHIAFFLTALLITMPLAFWMFDQVPAVLTLRRLPPRNVQLVAA